MYNSLMLDVVAFLYKEIKCKCTTKVVNHEMLV